MDSTHENGRQEEEDQTHLSEILDDLENDGNNDPFLQLYREKRMQEISDHFKLVEKNVREKNYGRLQELDGESQLLSLSSKCPKLVVHFMVEKFSKCQYMNDKLEILARKYLTTKFVKISVENCPFLVEKLKIKVLPFLMGYKEGQERFRSIGFAKLGNDPNGFPTTKLENLLERAGLVSLQPKHEDGTESRRTRESDGPQYARYSDSDAGSELDI